MLQVISGLIRNQAFQDIAGVTRGIIRIVDGTKCTQQKQQHQLPNTNPTTQAANEQQQASQPLTVDKQQLQQQYQQQPIPTPKVSKVDEKPYTPEQRAEFNPTENKVPETAFQRAYQFSSLGLSLASNAVRKVVTSKFTSDSVSFRQAMLSEENAQLLAKGLCKMRGAPLKLAQALSLQEDELIPKQIRIAFEQARQSADIMPQQQLEKLLIEAWGSNWNDNFAEFSLKPFAAASIGQVHKAVLKESNMAVAVKIQYPGVKQSIDSDLSNIKRLMDYTNVFPKTMFLDKLMANTRKELYEECDYLLEASKQVKYGDLYGDQKEYQIPKVIMELTTHKILVGQYLEGDSLDFVADNYPQYLRNEIGKRIMSLTLQELFKFRYMQTDPNPSNFYFNRKSNQLILIDFGAVHEYDKQFMDHYIQIIHGAAIKNRQQTLSHSVDIGFLTGEESIRMKEAHIDSIMTVGEPFYYEGEFDFSAQQITQKIYELMPVMLKYRLRPPPPEVYSLHRKLSGAYLMNMRLKSKINCRDIFMNLYDQYQKE